MIVISDDKAKRRGKIARIAIAILSVVILITLILIIVGISCGWFTTDEKVTQINRVVNNNKNKNRIKNKDEKSSSNEWLSEDEDDDKTSTGKSSNIPQQIQAPRIEIPQYKPINVHQNIKLTKESDESDQTEDESTVSDEKPVPKQQEARKPKHSSTKHYYMPPFEKLLNLSKNRFDQVGDSVSFDEDAREELKDNYKNVNFNTVFTETYSTNDRANAVNFVMLPGDTFAPLNGKLKMSDYGRNIKYCYNGEEYLLYCKNKKGSFPVFVNKQGHLITEKILAKSDITFSFQYDKKCLYFCKGYVNSDGIISVHKTTEKGKTTDFMFYL